MIYSPGMKTILGLMIAMLALGACGSKKPEATVPTNKQQEMPKDESAKDNAKPDDKTDAADPKKSEDPCGG
jgi:hypothetical protein